MTAAATIEPPARRLPIGGVIALIGLVAFGGVLLWRFALFAALGRYIVTFPDQFDYGEGIVWQQMLLMFTPDAYGRIDGFPSIVFHYPPVFHAGAAALSRLTGLDGLAAGRLLSLLATFATALFAGLLTARMLEGRAGARTRWLAGAAAGLALLTVWPLLLWAPRMRVDVLACAFALGGMLLAVRAFDGKARLIHVAALCFVLSVFTKQVFVAAPAATFIVLLWLRPRIAWAGIASSIAMGLVVLGGLEWATGGGFIRHVLFYNVNRFDPARLMILVPPLTFHIAYLAVAAAGVTAVARRVAAVRRATAGSTDILNLVMLVYLAIKTLMLPMIGKVGSADNYMMEWFCAVMIFMGVGVAPLIARIAERPLTDSGAPSRWPMVAMLVPALLAAQAIILPGWQRERPDAGRTRERAALIRRIALADKPVISDDMVIVIRAGKRVVWEPAIFAELAHTGQYDERPFVDRIKRGEISFFVTEGVRGDPLFDDRYNPAIADAIDAAYPVKVKLAGMVLHLPAGAR